MRQRIRHIYKIYGSGGGMTLSQIKHTAAVFTGMVAAVLVFYLIGHFFTDVLGWPINVKEPMLHPIYFVLGSVVSVMLALWVVVILVILVEPDR